MPRSYPPLSVAEMAALRGAAIENAVSLIADADLLMLNQRYARAYALSVLAIEETSKILLLLAYVEELDAGQEPTWQEVYEHLEGHHAKLMMNRAYWTSRHTPEIFDLVGTDQWKQLVNSAKEMNARKQRAFYASLEDGKVSVPEAVIDRPAVVFALKMARMSFNMFELVSRQFDAERATPGAKVEVRMRYSLIDEPVVDN